MRRLARVRWTVLLIWGLCAVTAIGDEPATPTVLFGRVIDGTGAPAIERGAVVIDGATIVAVGERDGVEVPGDATVFDLGSATILPGFINAHVHNSHSDWVARQWVRGGVTTVRDLGVPYGRVNWNAVSDRYDADPKLPLVLWAGPLVTVPNGYPIAGNGFSSLAARSPEDARRAILGLITTGVDVIKIALALDSTVPASLSQEEIEAIVEAAHEHGKRVTAHVQTRREAEMAILGGVDELAHAVVDYMPNDTIDRMTAEEIAWVPTLAIMRGAGGVAVLRFLRTGGLLAMGNDAGYLSGVLVGMPMNEIRAMARAGMTSMEILVASTSSAARVCAMEGTIGTLAVGLQADVLVVDGNPLDDLEVLDDTLLVFHRGVLVEDLR